MGKGLFTNENSAENKVEFANCDTSIDEKIIGMSVGDAISFPVSKKGTITGRVSDLNRKYFGERVWHTKTEKIEFRILVIRDK